MEILIDAKLWNKAFKEMRAGTVAWIRQNKGSSPKKHLIKHVTTINLSKTKISKGFFVKNLCRHGLVSLMLSYLGYTDARAKDAEVGIVKTLIKDGLLPTTVLYDGKALVKEDPAPRFKPYSSGFVYFVRNGEIFKIGITENLLRRLNELKPDEVLNVVRCRNYQEVEKKLHQSFKASRIPQTEYFRLVQDQIELVHREMAVLADF